MKTCTGCQLEKPLDEFNKYSRSPDGVRSRCRNCTKKESAAWYAENRDEKLLKNAQWHSQNIERRKEHWRTGNAKNKQQRSQWNKDWHKKNADNPSFRARSSLKSNTRRVRKLMASPVWLDAIQKAQIQEFYDIAIALNTQCGGKHEVDHIVPLKGCNVSGLNVPWNLQILKKEENLAKGNRLMEES